MPDLHSLSAVKYHAPNTAVLHNAGLMLGQRRIKRRVLNCSLAW